MQVYTFLRRFVYVLLVSGSGEMAFNAQQIVQALAFAPPAQQAKILAQLGVRLDETSAKQLAQMAPTAAAGGQGGASGSGGGAGTGERRTTPLASPSAAAAPAAPVAGPPVGVGNIGGTPVGGDAPPDFLNMLRSSPPGINGIGATLAAAERMRGGMPLPVSGASGYMGGPELMAGGPPSAPPRSRAGGPAALFPNMPNAQQAAAGQSAEAGGDTLGDILGSIAPSSARAPRAASAPPAPQYRPGSTPTPDMMRLFQALLAQSAQGASLPPMIDGRLLGMMR